MYAIGIGFLIAAYFLIPALFYLGVFIICLYILASVYRFIERKMAPPGHRIRHDALRGHLEHEYGTKEGRSLYKQMVKELRERGYK